VGHCHLLIKCDPRQNGQIPEYRDLRRGKPIPRPVACHNVGDILEKKRFALLLKVYQIVLQLEQNQI
jgi:hypothetical protein